MKNITVRGFIEHLLKCDQDAVVCRLIVEDNDCYSAIEMIQHPGVVTYIDDAGNDVVGNIIAIY